MVNRLMGLPDEVISHIFKEPRNIMIRGYAGAGKTIFALNIFQYILSKGGIAYYLVTMMSKKKFLSIFPWLKEYERYILDFESLKLDLIKKLGLPIRDYESVRALFYEISSAKKYPKVFIVDSIDYLKYKLEVKENDITLEEFLLLFSSEERISLIFLKEEPNESPLDSMMDDVITLKKKYIRGRVYREIIFDRIYGELLPKNVYPFSLIEHKFYHFREIYPVPSISKIEKKEIKGEKVPTLIPELDRILNGGYQRGSINLLYAGKNTRGYYRWIVVPSMANLLLNEIPVFILPSAGASYSDVERWIMPLVGRELFEKYLYIFQPPPEDVWKKNIFRLFGKSFMEDYDIIMDNIKAILKKLNSTFYGFFIGSDTLENVYGANEFKKTFGFFARDLIVTNGVVFLIYKYGQKTAEILINFANTHFRIINKNGNILVYGESPVTPYYALVVDDKGHSNLIPIR